MPYQFMPTQEERKRTPLIGTQDELPLADHVVHFKYFCPWNQWTWYVFEYDGDDMCFGYVIGFEKEVGYFTLSELREVSGPGGLRIERDIHWTPKKVSEIRELNQ